MRKVRNLIQIAVAIVVVGIGVGAFFVTRPHVAHAATISDPVLFIHGIAGQKPYGSKDSVPAGCNGDWQDVMNYLRHPPNNDPGFTGPFQTIGYYGVDGDGGQYHHCDVNFDLGAIDTPSAHVSRCDSYLYRVGDDGTNNQDLRNIACQLAWYIYNTYSSHYQNVRVVAHSMGGMIIRWALDRVENKDSAFPPFLYVPVVMTIATPHGGVPNPTPSAWYECGGCLMVSELQGIDNSKQPHASYFLSMLQAETAPPKGNNPGGTQWTLMSSICDNWAYVENGMLTGGVAPDAAFNFPFGAEKYYYQQVLNAPTSCPQPSYGHGDYMHDLQTTLDATGTFCISCSGIPGGPQLNFAHSIHIIYIALAADVPEPPTPPCYATTEQDDNQPPSHPPQTYNPYPDNRGNTWYVYYDIKRDANTNQPCQMRVVVRIFNPAPDGSWSGTTGVFAEKNGSYQSSSFGIDTWHGTYQAHFVWRGPWFSVGAGIYHIEDTEYNGSTPYIRAAADFTLQDH